MKCIRSNTVQSHTRHWPNTDAGRVDVEHPAATFDIELQHLLLPPVPREDLPASHPSPLCSPIAARDGTASSLFRCTRAALSFRTPIKTHSALCVIGDAPPNRAARTGVALRRRAANLVFVPACVRFAKGVCGSACARPPLDPSGVQLLGRIYVI